MESLVGGGDDSDRVLLSPGPAPPLSRLLRQRLSSGALGRRRAPGPLGRRPLSPLPRPRPSGRFTTAASPAQPRCPGDAVAMATVGQGRGSGRLVPCRDLGAPWRARPPRQNASTARRKEILPSGNLHASSGDWDELARRQRVDLRRRTRAPLADGAAAFPAGRELPVRTASVSRAWPGDGRRGGGPVGTTGSSGTPL